MDNMDNIDYKERYFAARRDAFVTNAAYSKAIELVNLILNPGSIGNIEESAREFRHAVKSAEKTLAEVEGGNVELGVYMGLIDA
mgnify:CR=1 FL=1|tara:strand:- start:345 stop:596 length:252 start_codon:yes stop_codon:yes gene_type:complete